MSYAQSEGEKQMTERAIKTESVTVTITQSVDCFPSFFVGFFWGKGAFISHLGGFFCFSWAQL